MFLSLSTVPGSSQHHVARQEAPGYCTVLHCTVLCCTVLCTCYDTKHHRSHIEFVGNSTIPSPALSPPPSVPRRWAILGCMCSARVKVELKPDPTATGFSAQNGYFFSSMCAAAYSEEDDARQVLEALGFGKFHWFEVGCCFVRLPSIALQIVPPPVLCTHFSTTNQRQKCCR